MRGKVLFVGVHSHLDTFYREMLPDMETMDINPNTPVPPDIVGDIQYCPQVKDESYSGVIMVGVYESLTAPQKAFSEINRITRRGGKAMLGLPGPAYYPDKPVMTPERVFSEIKPLLLLNMDITYYRNDIPYYLSIISEKR